MTEPRATIADLRTARLCIEGLQVWCESHGLDHKELLKWGASLEMLRGLNDAFADRIIQTAEARILKEKTDGR